MKFLYLCLLSLLLYGCRSRYYQPVYVESFKRLDLKTWKYSGNQKVQLTPDGLEFEIEPGDFRSELTGNRLYPKNYPFGSSWWYRFRIKVPEDFEPDPYSDILVQFHSWYDPDQIEHDLNPPLRLRIKGDQYEIEQLGDSSTYTEKPIYSFKHTQAVGTVQAGEEICWTFFCQWDYRSGKTLVWKDSELVYEMEGANGFNDPKGNYLKFGIYSPLRIDKNDWQRRHYTFSELIIAKGAKPIKAISRQIEWAAGRLP